jgi:hypothetical protein
MGKWQSIPNQVVQAYLHAPSGRPCTTGQSFKIARRNTFEGMKIAMAPQHGSATASGHRITYKSSPGYVGSDSFMFTIHGTTSGKPRVASVQVNVTVD